MGHIVTQDLTQSRLLQEAACVSPASKDFSLSPSHSTVCIMFTIDLTHDRNYKILVILSYVTLEGWYYV